MLGTVYYKGIAGISSMQGMTRNFNDDIVTKNIYHFMGSESKEYLPHGVTVNEFLERLEPSELEEIQSDIVYRMIRRKTFDDAKVLGKWLVIVDGTELDEGKTQKNENYLSRSYNKGKENEFTKYHRSVLAAKIKKHFPRLPICIVADALYVSEDVMKLCKSNQWDYIIRYKEGCAPTVEEEYGNIPEKKKVGNAEYVNGIIYKDFEVNVLKYSETKVKKGEKVTTDFCWITNIEITDKNADKLVRAGRYRWKIENQGFNRQKHWQGDIEHACSWNEKAQKNHYLLEQIADFMKQLYEYFFLKRNEIIKTQKNISSELLASFGRQLTETEDISAQLNGSVVN